jgi:hypothetical protein
MIKLSTTLAFTTLALVGFSAAGSFDRSGHSIRQPRTLGE